MSSDDDHDVDDLLETIDRQRQRLHLLAEMLLDLGFDPLELLEAVD
jgi:hypothetical protein